MFMSMFRQQRYLSRIGIPSEQWTAKKGGKLSLVPPCFRNHSTRDGNLDMRGSSPPFARVAQGKEKKEAAETRLTRRIAEIDGNQLMMRYRCSTMMPRRGRRSGGSRKDQRRKRRIRLLFLFVFVCKYVWYVL
jgi:hypothetical protein